MWWMLLMACTLAPDVEEAPVEITVVRGDTLSKLARTHGVSVDALRAANGIEGDLIEVGQVLRLPEGGVEAPAPSRSRPRAAPVASGSRHGLTRPRPQPCLDPPDGTDLGEEGMVGSRGLSATDVQQVMGPHLQHTLRCPDPEGDWPVGSVSTEVTVACDGTVAGVRVLGSDGLDASTVECVRDVLSHAGFPPHDLPDGYVFTQPVRFSP